MPQRDNLTQEIPSAYGTRRNAREKQPNYRTALCFVKTFSNYRIVGLSWRGALSLVNSLTALQKSPAEFE